MICGKYARRKFTVLSRRFLADSGPGDVPGRLGSDPRVTPVRRDRSIIIASPRYRNDPRVRVRASVFQGIYPNLASRRVGLSVLASSHTHYGADLCAPTVCSGRGDRRPQAMIGAPSVCVLAARDLHYPVGRLINGPRIADTPIRGKVTADERARRRAPRRRGETRRRPPGGGRGGDRSRDRSFARTEESAR